MTIGFGTAVFTSNTNATASSITNTNTLADGETLWIGAVVSSDDTFTLSCTSFPGGGPPTINTIGSAVTDTNGNQRYTHYYVENPGAGSYTFTWAGTPVANTWPDLFSVPIIGGVTTGILVANGPGQFQNNPATTTDLLTSGTAQTPSAYPALVAAFSCDAQCAATPAAGTGFTSGGTGFGFFGFGAGGRIESKRITSGTAQALFTAGSTSSSVVTMMAVFQEAAAAATSDALGGSGQRLLRNSAIYRM